MLYQLGPLAIDTMPFSADSMGRDGGGDLAAKDVMNRLRPREFMGEADEKIQISGQLLPSKIGGLAELEMAHAMSRSGTALPLMRGDGKMYGWFAIEHVSEQHADLLRTGVGFTVKYTLDLVKVDPDSSDQAGSPAPQGIVGMLLSLFETL
ncbi:phage tail protein [Paradevosia shaoguanensis]|uniref:Phage tail protein n=1 Tax=Paradevosia shaoguanensis TaxID=1335043 RepID=A0AA41QPP4_9HYPH|nr:phage tail protein [Paradevosia shaoguanensis]MCF1744239.1 phage tail protein [Paradevosia shaoguanensis]MCI0128722.1 phage tail protein [Paradevosia shaoguanensis]